MCLACFLAFGLIAPVAERRPNAGHVCRHWSGDATAYLRSSMGRIAQVVTADAAKRVLTSSLKSFYEGAEVGGELDGMADSPDLDLSCRLMGYDGLRLLDP